MSNTATVLKDNNIYVVNGYRDGIREKHSYTVAVFSDKEAAIQSAEQHCYYRGGKYSMVVEKLIINTSNTDDEEPVIEVYRAKGRNDNKDFHLNFIKKQLQK